MCTFHIESCVACILINHERYAFVSQTTVSDNSELLVLQCKRPSAIHGVE